MEKLAFWKNRQKEPQKKTEGDPFDADQMRAWGIEPIRKIAEEKTEVFPRAPALSKDPVKELQYLNQLNALDALAKRLRRQRSEPFSKWLPSKVMVAWFDRAFSVLHIREMAWVGDGMVADNWWGRAADVLGPNARPITITVKGKASAGFIVDGDKGVGINIERKDGSPGEDGAYAKLNTTSELAWSIIDVKKFQEAFGAGVTQRTLWIVAIVVLIMGMLIGHSIK